MVIEAIDPFSNKIIKTYAAFDPQHIEQTIQNAEHAYQNWRYVPFIERALCIRKTATILRDQKNKLALLMTQEMGKTISESQAEIEKCAWVCDYYADNAENFLQPEPIRTDAQKSFVCFKPLGLVLAVMPWNFPFWQVFRFAAPNLMAGNGALLKHASNVPGCALAIEDIFKQAGLPVGLFSTLLISSSQVSAVIAHPMVKAVTLTGSTPAGRAVAKQAGACLKKTVLELGGSDPYVVLFDADIEQATDICVTSKLLNAGQSCIAAKRFIVVQSHLAKFEERMTAKMKAAKMGDPREEDTVIGPMARVDLRDELHEQVQSSISKGARCLLGGQIPEQTGAFYPPTVLTNVKPGMPAYDDELFGPVAAIIAAKDEKEAIVKANDTIFGLGACIFTNNTEKGERIAVDELEAGSCFVNTFVKSDPRLPFGGIKESGFGRELSLYGIREFVNIKTVYIR